MQEQEKSSKSNNNICSRTDEYAYIKSYMFVKGFAVAKNLRQTLIALSIARQFHNGQYRNDGLPYIIHPLKVCTTVISYGIDDDITLSAALLHDLLEDCKDSLPLKGQELICEYHLSEEVLEIVKLLTKKSGLTNEELSIYFNKIQGNYRAALIKLSDRLHNCSSLYTFSPQRMNKYIKETEQFLIPMASYCKKYYPDYVNAFTILKTSIFALNNSMKIMLEKYGPEIPSTPILQISQVTTSLKH